MAFLKKVKRVLSSPGVYCLVVWFCYFSLIMDVFSKGTMALILLVYSALLLFTFQLKFQQNDKQIPK